MKKAENKMEMESTETRQPEPEINQPGLSKLREAVANHLGPRLPRGASLRQDIVAGLNSAIGSTPDGMANGILAGVNPVYGLYGSAAGAFVGGFLSSTQLMVITATSAAALAANQTLSSLPPGEQRDSALFTMVILVGLFQVLLGLLGTGRLVRFVSYSVMTGFLTGIAMLMILSQIPTITGYDPAGNNKIAQTINVIANASQINLISLGLAIFTLILVITLPRTRVGNFSSLVAIIAPSILVALFRLESVEIVRDVGEIPPGIPMPFLPSLSHLTTNVITGAFAVAVITLVQAAGVSQSVPNPDGSRRRLSRDFLSQGAANIAAGIFRGLPVGGSLSATALSLSASPRTRWSAIFTGVWMTLIVLVFPSLIAYIAMPALGALLINVGFKTIKPSEVVSIWQTGLPSRLAIIATFTATLFLPIEVAVGIGVVLSAFLYLSESSTDISVVELVKDSSGEIEEQKAPEQLSSNHVTVLDVYGNLFYAGARTLERLLPEPRGAQNPVVILRLRGRTTVGATLVDMLANYARKLQAVNGRLYLTGISRGVYEQIIRTGKLHLTGPVRVYEATPVRGQSTDEAYADAQTWLVRQGPEVDPDKIGPGGEPG
ncbi:MAG: SulP family inorganic anion transporter [Caldilineaceae bacterium]|nr:SulP family inorganic anion transporter [Caldilineaceae bacterium]